MILDWADQPSFNAVFIREKDDVTFSLSSFLNQTLPRGSPHGAAYRCELQYFKIILSIDRYIVKEKHNLLVPPYSFGGQWVGSRFDRGLCEGQLKSPLINRRERNHSCNICRYAGEYN